MNNYLDDGEEVGFDEEQLRFLEKYFATLGHIHLESEIVPDEIAP